MQTYMAIWVICGRRARCLQTQTYAKSSSCMLQRVDLDCQNIIDFIIDPSNIKYFIIDPAVCYTREFPFCNNLMSI